MAVACQLVLAGDILSLMNWYCVHTKPRKEKQVAAYLHERLSLETYFPRLKQRKTIRRVRRLVTGPLFPRYLFTRFDFSAEYRAVRYSPDVLDVVSSGGRAAIVTGDLADPSAVATLVPAACAALGPLGCLINNAALFAYDDIASLERPSWDAQVAINLTAPVFLAKAMAEQLPANANGNIINIIDQRVLKPTPHFLSYSLSKSGLWWMTRTLAQALAPAIRVNAIGPGPMLQSVHQSDAEFSAQTNATLLERGTSPAEVAAAIQFILASPAMTGQMLTLDGGQHLAWATPDIGDGRG